MLDGTRRDAVDKTTQPVGRALVRVGITADVLTVFGLVMSVVTALVIGSGHFVLGIVMLFPTGLPDLFDGAVAKASGTASVRGAFFDSVADRVSDAFLYGGVAWYLASHHHGTTVLLPFAILAVTYLISYERAKAELLGLSSKGGLMERAERFIILGACLLAASIDVRALVPALWVFLGLVSATAAGRFVRGWREAEAPVRASRSGMRSSIGASELARRRVARWRDLRADSRWRAWRESQKHGMRSVLQRRGGEPWVRRWGSREVSDGTEAHARPRRWSASARRPMSRRTSATRGGDRRAARSAARSRPDRRGDHTP